MLESFSYTAKVDVAYPYIVIHADLRSKNTHRMRKQISLLISGLLIWLVLVLQIFNQPIRWYALILSLSCALLVSFLYVRERRTASQ